MLRWVKQNEYLAIFISEAIRYALQLLTLLTTIYSADKTVLFHNLLKRLKLKTLASDGVIKKEYNSLAQVMSSYICYIL